MTSDKQTCDLVSEILAAQNGDSEAWSGLLKTYRPALENWASSFSLSNELSQSDLVQTAWMQIFKGLDTFTGVENPEHVAPMFYQWLKITSRNAMLTLLKGHQAKFRTPDKPIINGHDFALADSQQRTPSSIVAKEEQLARLAAAIKDLNDPLDRQIVLMVTEDGLSLRLVATVLGKDYSTIRRRFHKLLARLGRSIAD